MNTHNFRLEDIWTDDFEKFKAKIEPIFGPLDELAKEYPDVYAHIVLSHGFMEYEGIRNISMEIKMNIKKEMEDGCEYDKKEQRNVFYKYLKDEYLKWAKNNNLPENLVEMGWESYLND